MSLGIVILAAGQGTRMKSALPKVLHPLAAKPLLGHVIDTARTLNPARIVMVYGHGGELVRQTLDAPDLAWAEQAEQLGTGHAVQQALPLLEDVDRVLVLYGDVPLTAGSTLQQLIAGTDTALGLLTVDLDDPTGYGRIVRDSGGKVERIVEQKDANAAELAIREINTGIMLIDMDRLKDWLSRLSNDNTQGEYYLTDIIAMAVGEDVCVHVAQPADPLEAEGVNTRQQLARLERAYQVMQADTLMLAGVSLCDPARFDIRGRLQAGQDVSIDINVIIEGEVRLGDRVQIGANSVLRDVSIDDDCVVLENCVLESAQIGPGCRIGPFARIRPDTVLNGEAHVGNFVEIKKSTIGLGSKVNHLSYIGDSVIGAGVNVGAGTITCNYDGANKHQTVIGDNAFIGSNTALVAPVTVASGATIGAGSVVTKDAPADKLTLTRARQMTVNNWQRPVKPIKKNEQ